MVFLYEFVDWDDTVLVSLNLLVDVEGLKLGQDLDYCLLHASFYHKGAVIRSGKSLFFDLYTIDGTHSIPDLVVLLGHKLSTSLIEVLAVRVFKDKNLSLLPEVYFVQNLNAGISRIQVVVEMRHVLFGQSIELSNLEEASY